MVIDPHAEIQRLRTALRDLVALSTIPAAWVGREPPAIAAGLADVLVRSLHLDFAFVRLCDPKGGTAVEAARGNAWKAFPEWLQRHLAVVGQFSRREIISDVGRGAQPCRGIVIPIGVDGEGGLLAAACDRSDFPTEIDQLLLSVASNHAATAFQSARLVHERRSAEEALRKSEQELRQARNELEMKVVERTAELRRSEGYLAEAQRLTHTGSWAWNIATRDYIYWSQERYRLFGFDPETDIPSFEEFRQRIHPDDQDRFVEIFEKAIRERADFEVDYRAVLPDGRMKYIHSVGHPVFNASGDLVEYVGMGMDVTERKRAEEEREALLASERAARAEAVAAHHRFRDLVNSVDGIVWEADAETFVFSFVSEQAERILGYPIERWLNEPTFWQDHLHPDDRDWAVGFCLKATAEKRDHDFEYRMIAADGRIVWLRDLVAVVVEGDRTASLRGVMLDITERKRAEYLTEQVFESSPDGVSIIGRDYRYQRVNPIYERIWGTPAERIVGMHAADLLGMEVFAQKVKPNLDRCFAGEDVHFAEWFVSPLGRRYMGVSYSPLRPDSERVEAALVIFRDLTEHMLASEALQKAQADLAHISRVTTMGELTASLAHEINQPITAAVTNANTCLRWLTRDQPDVAEARAAAARIVKDATRAANIISRIRLLFKKGAPERELVDVNDVIREMIVLLRNEATRYSISIRTELADALPKVLADRVQLQQVFMNLMLNGIDAMKDVKPAGELTIKSQQDGSGQLRISVSDTGVGLPPEQADQIFNAFFTTKAHGTGMGLPISRSIVESHGGRLWATTNSGRGTTFQFTLPGEVEARE
jgi:PAS domain S-box-containing protein